MGLFLHLICITMTTGPAFSLSSCCPRPGRLQSVFPSSWPGGALGSSFLSVPTAVEAGPPFPAPAGFPWEVRSCLQVRTWALGISFPGLHGISFQIHSQVITAGCSLLADWANPQESGSLGTASSGSKISHGLWRHLSSCPDSSKLPQTELRFQQWSHHSTKGTSDIGGGAL